MWNKERRSKDGHAEAKGALRILKAKKLNAACAIGYGKGFCWHDVIQILADFKRRSQCLRSVLGRGWSSFSSFPFFEAGHELKDLTRSTHEAQGAHGLVDWLRFGFSSQYWVLGHFSALWLESSVTICWRWGLHGTSWNHMDVRWWDDEMMRWSCFMFFSSFEIKNFSQVRQLQERKDEEKAERLRQGAKMSWMSWQQRCRHVDMQNSNEDYKWPSHSVKYSSQLAKMASWKSRRFQNLRSKQWLLNMLWHVVTVIACIVRVFPRPARTLLRWCLPPISSGSCRVLQTCCNLSAFDSFAWHAW